MGELKTKKTKISPTAFIKTVQDKAKQKDSLVLLKMFADVTGQKPVMWGGAIIGYGEYHYESKRSSQKGDWFLTGFSPRKANLTLYIMHGLTPADLKALGPFKRGGGCLYINHLSDVNLAVLKKAMVKNYKYIKPTGRTLRNNPHSN